MSRYRIRIEKLDFDHNIKYQSQVEINQDMIDDIQRYHGLDALDVSFNQLKLDFLKHMENYERKNEQRRKDTA